MHAFTSSPLIKPNPLFPVPFEVTMPSISKPAIPPTTIVLIQGAFQTPLVYTRLHKALESDGYPTISPPSYPAKNTSAPNLPLTTLLDDAVAIRAVVSRLVEDEEKNVFVVMHSYGDLAGSEAIPESLSRASRAHRGMRGGVVHLFFFAALVISPGQSCEEVFGSSPNTFVDVERPIFLRLFSPLSMEKRR
jgi:hypothetical protein